MRMQIRKGKRPLLLALILLVALASVAGGYFGSGKLPFQGQTEQKRTMTLGARQQANAPTPFMHRPYYGDQSISSRTVSFVDHDKPWYDYDGVFVRYDGKKWTGVSIGSCTGGVNCYDGHNGYDLNLHYEPVLSAAAGTVIRAGWYDPTNHESSLGLWAAIDHGNGFVTAYGHLSALTVAVGDTVGTQWQLGTSGTTGSSTGPHLHMATYYLPDWNATDPFGWTGNYPDPNVVPDYYLWVNNPGTNNTVPLLSSNGNAVYPGATLVDDGDPGWSSTGTWYTATSSTDIKGNLHWTTTSSGAATATATWQSQLPVAGYYEVGVFVDDNHASSGWAPYTIYSDDPNQPGTVIQHTVYVDEEHIGSFPGPYGWENTGPQWVSLGTYYFSASMPGRVVLSNATGENGLQLAADGVEFAPVASLPASTPPVYSFAVSSDDTPTTMLPNSTTKVDLTLQNTGNFTWPATGTAAVALTYRWLNAQNHVVLTGNTIALPQDVGPNHSVSLSVSVQTPAVPVGMYTLQWDMVQGATVFSQQGAKTHNDRVEIATYTNLPETYYFAEGYTGTGTSEYLSLTNPSAIPASITINYLFQGSKPLTRTYVVAAQRESVLNINREVGANKAVGMVVQGNQPFVAERTIYAQKDAFVSATDGVGITALSRKWYFADARTTFGWNTLLSVLNPSAQLVTLNVTRLTNTGVGNSKSYTIAPNSRGTIVLNTAFPNQQFGLIISASSPVAIEEPMYLMVGPFRGGSVVAGVPAPQQTWYFGAGNTSAGFKEHLVLANPGSQAANVQVRYLLANGQVITQNVTVPAQGRSDVNVASVVKSALHATVITATVPIVAEREDFFTAQLNGIGAVTGSTAVMGSSLASTSWYVAQGDTSAGHAESLALANPGTASAQVQVVYYQASAAPTVKTYTLAANTRMTLNLSNEVGANHVVGTAIYSTQPIVVEQTMFFNLNGATGGYASMGLGL